MRLWRKVCKYRSSMIMMGEKLKNELFVLALYISVIDGHVKHGWPISSVLEGSFMFILADVLHTWCLIPHTPAPSCGSAWSIFSWLQRLPDTGLLTGLYHWEIRFSVGSASGKWNSVIRSHWLCIWLSWHLRKTWKLGKRHPGCPSTVSWNSDISASISLSRAPGHLALFSHLQPDRLSLSLRQMLFCLCPEHISVYFWPDGQCSARACLKNHSRDLHSPLCG